MLIVDHRLVQSARYVKSFPKAEVVDAVITGIVLVYRIQLNTI